MLVKIMTNAMYRPRWAPRIRTNEEWPEIHSGRAVAVCSKFLLAFHFVSVAVAVAVFGGLRFLLSPTFHLPELRAALIRLSARAHSIVNRSAPESGCLVIFSHGKKRRKTRFARTFVAVHVLLA